MKQQQIKSSSINPTDFQKKKIKIAQKFRKTSKTQIRQSFTFHLFLSSIYFCFRHSHHIRTSGKPRVAWKIETTFYSWFFRKKLCSIFFILVIL